MSDVDPVTVDPVTADPPVVDPANVDPATVDSVVGVAVLIPEPWGSVLQARRAGFGDERAWRIPTHVTLLPPTPVTREQILALMEHLRSVCAQQQPFEMVLRGTGTFRPVSQVVYVQVAQGFSASEQLACAVHTGPLTRPLEFPYHPHVTVAQDLPPDVLDRVEAELSGFSCRFLVDRVGAYVHNGNERWEPIGDYGLGGGLTVGVQPDQATYSAPTPTPTPTPTPIAEA